MDIEVLELIQRKSMELVKGLEHKPDDDVFRELGLTILEIRRLRYMDQKALKKFNGKLQCWQGLPLQTKQGITPGYSPKPGSKDNDQTNTRETPTYWEDFLEREENVKQGWLVPAQMEKIDLSCHREKEKLMTWFG
ncbi:hypothetical protein WISP_42092 [Willisornis vidua]|uniref:Uncharacterized protein n=1 Tax=Willisornis vidua TaxID=1566151 RepID=A0ABQ9DGG0_9PASS|nr:hypothetical protein WISP_42092 [Willisornis vidua]